MITDESPIPGFGERVRTKGAEHLATDQVLQLDPNLQSGECRFVVTVIDDHVVSSAYKAVFGKPAKARVHDRFRLITELVRPWPCGVVKIVPRSSPSLKIRVHSAELPSEELMTYP